MTGPGEDPDAALARLGEALAAAVTAALPGYLRTRADGVVPPDWPGRAAVVEELEAAAHRAAAEAGAALGALLGADVDHQGRTPLEVVRAAVGEPTAVLRRAGVPAPARDDFARNRFPADPYGLAPASLAAVAPGLGELAVTWGAAKAMAHRRRHRSTGG